MTEPKPVPSDEDRKLAAKILAEAIEYGRDCWEMTVKVDPAKAADLIAAYRVRVEQEVENRVQEYYGGILSMTVARLEGTVEGYPTHTGNFLQRIDELRKIERKALGGDQ